MLEVDKHSTRALINSLFERPGAATDTRTSQPRVRIHSTRWHLRPPTRNESHTPKLLETLTGAAFCPASPPCPLHVIAVAAQLQLLPLSHGRAVFQKASSALLALHATLNDKATLATSS